MDTATNVTTWLMGLPGVFIAQPVKVKIGRTEYEGARYRQACDWQGKPYTREAFYLVGPLPAAYRRSRRIAFTIPGSPFDWYVASYAPEEVTTAKAYRHFHPFGQSLQLAPWTAIGPRPRIAIAVQETGPRTGQTIEPEEI